MADTHPAKNSVRLDLHALYSGSVRVASDTKGPARRATIQLYEADSSEPVETTTFVEKSPRTGELVLETDNDIVVWFYSAQAKGAYVKISIEVNYNGKFQYLNTMKPLTVRQAPTASSKADFYLSAILADDVSDKGSENYSFDDGIVTVLEYK
ncbi:hypothetical protein CCMSSC00406_0009646 [Pleurotus cornucopiae]|uniref:Uncharacterized protein n=1 Tax=Pleurotus cornucopiae TaxID=5321 RepID=A0ACB7J958_PLECO|nr:hypothetical protein CCMSSC00406_0009646 [Pleurotus cornucopiae]